MRTFVFYPYLASDTALMFEEAVAADLGAAVVVATALLNEHHSAERVEIWEGDVLHHTVRRTVGEPS